MAAPWALSESLSGCPDLLLVIDIGEILQMMEQRDLVVRDTAMDTL